MKRILTIVLVLSVLSISASVASAAGIMIPRDKDLPPLAIESHKVAIKIDEQGAVTTVEQVFRNNTDRQLEATYVFPLPEGATISDFGLWMNGKKVTGEVVDKDKAKQIYTEIVRRMKDPGLLEYLGNNLFRASIYPVPPRSTQRVQLVFAQAVPAQSGLCKYVYPLRTGEKSSRTLADFEIVARIKSSVPIKSVYSPSHKIEVTRESDRQAWAGVETTGASLAKDFVLYYSLSEKDMGVSLITYRRAGEDGYFMLLANPKTELSSADLMDKDIVFVIDTSGSMSGEKIARAKQALRYCLDNLRPGDRFNIVRFSTGVEPFRDNLVAADKANIGSAKSFVDGMEPRGGTAIHDALLTALSQPPSSDRPGIVVFLTDGLPTVGATDEQTIAKDAAAKNRGRFRLFAFGVGTDVNTKLLDRLASEGRGAPTYVRPDEEIETELSAFYDRIAKPVMSDVQLDIPGVKTFDIFPKPLPDLFAGSQLIVLGRYKDGGATAIKVSGRAKNKTETVVHEGAFAKESDEASFVPKLWATRKVGYLLDQIRLNGSNKELVDEVRSLGTKFGIVTPYTSYLIVEDENQLAVGRNRMMPMEEAGPQVFGGRSGGGGKGSLKKDADAIDRTRRDEARAASRPDGFNAESGDSAVAASKAIRGYKEKTTAAAEIAEIRTVDDRTFVWKNGAFTDTAYAGSEKVLRVKYMSEAYMQIAARSPKLARALTLGENVVIVMKKGYAVIIGPAGKDTVTESELKEFL